MLSVKRLGKCWAAVENPDTREILNIRIDSMRQEISNPVQHSGLVVSFSTIVGDATLEQLEFSSPTPWEQDGEREVAFVINQSDGVNPVRLFDMIVPMLARIVMGGHKAMVYSKYQRYRARTDFRSLSYMVDQGSGTAVWDFVHVREYGLQDKLFSIVDEYARYRVGKLEEGEILPWEYYTFPEGFGLECEITFTTYLETLRVLLAKAVTDDESDLVKAYRVVREQ